MSRRWLPAAAALTALACTPAAAPPAAPAPSATATPAAAAPPAGPTPNPAIWVSMTPAPPPPAYQAAIAAPSLPFLRVWSGKRSTMDPPAGQVLARSAEEWRAFRTRHNLPADGFREPDYATEMRVAVTRTWGNAQSRLEIVGVEEQPERLVVRSILADDMGMMVSPAVSFPYDVVDLPRREQPVVFEDPIKVHMVYLPEARIRAAGTP